MEGIHNTRGFGACTVVCQDWEKPLPGRYLSYESGIPPGEIGSTRLSGGVWSLCWNQKLPMACFGKLTEDPLIGSKNPVGRYQRGVDFETVKEGAIWAALEEWPSVPESK